MKAHRWQRAAAVVSLAALVAAAVGGTTWATLRTRELRREPGRDPGGRRCRAGRTHRARRRPPPGPGPHRGDRARISRRSSPGSASSTRASTPRSTAIRAGRAQVEERSEVVAAQAYALSVMQTCLDGVERALAAAQDDQFEAAVLLLRAVEQPCRTALARSPASSGYALVDANFPDPFVVAHDGEYFAYATNGGGGSVQMARGPSLGELRLVTPGPHPPARVGCAQQDLGAVGLPAGRLLGHVLQPPGAAVPGHVHLEGGRRSARPVRSSTRRPDRSCASRAGRSTRRRSSRPTAPRGWSGRPSSSSPAARARSTASN